MLTYLCKWQTEANGESLFVWFKLSVSDYSYIVLVYSETEAERIRNGDETERNSSVLSSRKSLLRACYFFCFSSWYQKIKKIQ